ncbi:MAG: NAD(P)H-dependent oxidoreductase subunit E [Planctomycetes bacterium]|nr:NAD(P)H-dependent oxidoreductase subunit E [Planctomycetota bacterium]
MSREKRQPVEEPIDLAVVDEIVRRTGSTADATIPILQAIQAHFRYLPREALEHVCRTTEITAAQIAGVSTFYSQFRHKPVGRHMIRVCHGTACHVAGAPLITESLRRHLGIEDDDEDTDCERMFTIEKVPCLGCCSLAPCMTVDDVTYGKLTPHKAIMAIEKIRKESAR